jgi:type II secretory pathway pseudopilin PulG
MQKHVFRQSRGFSILELLLVLIVVAAILFTAVGRYQIYRREREINIIRENVAILYQALLLHYATNCNWGGYSVNINSFNNTGDPNYNQYQALLSKLIYLPMAPARNNYDVGAAQITSTPAPSDLPPPPPLYRLLVMVTLNVPATSANLSWYQQALGAQSVSVNGGQAIKLTFTRFPDYGAPNAADPLWLSHQNLQYSKRFYSIRGRTDTIVCAF